MADESISLTEKQTVALIDEILRRDWLYADVSLSVFAIMAVMRDEGYPSYQEA